MDELLKVLRKSDTVAVYKLDRISRSTKHLIELMEYFEAKGIHFVSIQDRIDTITAMGRFFFRMLASIAELERDIISERTKDGLTAARARGRNGGRPKVDLNKALVASAGLSLISSMKSYIENEIGSDEYGKVATVLGIAVGIIVAAVLLKSCVWLNSSYINYFRWKNRSY